jgi:hypothetical protein
MVNNESTRAKNFFVSWDAADQSLKEKIVPFVESLGFSLCPARVD